MAALLVSLAVMSVLMTAALPAWRHQAKREKEAELVFRGEQYVRAIRLWEKLGFAVVGRLPGAFRHQRLGLVDALVMFKTLVPAGVVYDPQP